MKKVVWFISKYFERPAEGTPGGRSFLLMNEMARQDTEVVVIASDSCNLYGVPDLTERVTKEKIGFLHVFWLKTMRYRTAKSLSRILSWFHFEWNLLCLSKRDLPRPDAVIVSSLSLMTILNGFLIRKKYGCKLIFEIRDIWPLTLTEEGDYSRWNPFILFLGIIERLGYAYSDVVVGTMPNLKEHVKNVIGYDKPVYCIPMGLANEFFLPVTDNLPQSFIEKHIPKDKFIIAYAGTIGITNALDTYLSAAELLGNNMNIHFVILGGGALKNSFVSRFGHLENLTFAPKVKKNEVQSFLSKCDLLYFEVFPSKIWDYGQSLNKVIDYMVSGKPILASYSGYPSMLNEAKCGYFLPAGDVVALVDKIKEIASMSREERSLLGHKGREWLISNRSYPKLASEYLDIIFK